MGARNWWMPAWLQRVVPEVHVEGHPQDYLPARDQRAAAGELEPALA